MIHFQDVRKKIGVINFAPPLMVICLFDNSPEFEGVTE
jgi:hypothetical protein